MGRCRSARVWRLGVVAAVAVLAVAVGAPGGTEIRASRPSTAPPSSEPVSTATASPAAAPNILLTNDNGWSAGGVLGLYEALMTAGFNVVVFAPAEASPGASAALSYGGTREVTRPFGSVFAVDGSPADAVEVGLSLAFPESLPDLVISGPSPGHNIGYPVIHSGTVGAAAAAINEGVPAIAVSTGADPDTNDVDFTVTNAFVVDLVNALVANASGGPLLPDGLGLNINVPFTPSDSPPAGVAITTTDRSFVDPDYSGVELPEVGESIDVGPELVDVPSSDPESDAGAIERGLVAVTFIEGDFDAAAHGERAAAIEVLTPVLTGLLD